MESNYSFNCNLHQFKSHLYGGPQHAFAPSPPSLLLGTVSTQVDSVSTPDSVSETLPDCCHFQGFYGYLHALLGAYI